MTYRVCTNYLHLRQRRQTRINRQMKRRTHRTTAPLVDISFSRHTQTIPSRVCKRYIVYTQLARINKRLPVRTIIRQTICRKLPPILKRLFELAVLCHNRRKRIRLSLARLISRSDVNRWCTEPYLDIVHRKIIT